MKIVIDLPEWYIKETQEFKHPNFVDKAIAEGVPLSEVLDEASTKVAPTTKQIKYATYLAKRVNISLPKEYTKEAYSEFISKWALFVQEEDKGMNEPDAWQMQYM